MCGIVGYVGGSEAAEFLLAGLRRLEYRGYDSAGIVTSKDHRLRITKSAGRVDELASKLGPADRRETLELFASVDSNTPA